MKSSQLTERREGSPPGPLWSTSLQKPGVISSAAGVTPKPYWPRLHQRLYILVPPKLTILSTFSVPHPHRLDTKKKKHDIWLGNQRRQQIDKVQRGSAPPKPAIKEKNDIRFIRMCLSDICLGFVCSREGSFPVLAHNVPELDINHVARQEVLKSQQLRREGVSFWQTVRDGERRLPGLLWMAL